MLQKTLSNVSQVFQGPHSDTSRTRASSIISNASHFFEDLFSGSAANQPNPGNGEGETTARNKTLSQTSGQAVHSNAHGTSGPNGQAETEASVPAAHSVLTNENPAKSRAEAPVMNKPLATSDSPSKTAVNDLDPGHSSPNEENRRDERISSNASTIAKSNSGNSANPPKQPMHRETQPTNQSAQSTVKQKAAKQGSVKQRSEEWHQDPDREKDSMSVNENKGQTKSRPHLSREERDSASASLEIPRETSAVTQHTSLSSKQQQVLHQSDIPIGHQKKEQAKVKSGRTPSAKKKTAKPAPLEASNSFDSQPEEKQYSPHEKRDLARNTLQRKIGRNERGAAEQKNQTVEKVASARKLPAKKPLTNAPSSDQVEPASNGPLASGSAINETLSNVSLGRDTFPRDPDSANELGSKKMPAREPSVAEGPVTKNFSTRKKLPSREQSAQLEQMAQEVSGPKEQVRKRVNAKEAPADSSTATGASPDLLQQPAETSPVPTIGTRRLPKRTPSLKTKLENSQKLSPENPSTSPAGPRTSPTVILREKVDSISVSRNLQQPESDYVLSANQPIGTAEQQIVALPEDKKRMRKKSRPPVTLSTQSSNSPQMKAVSWREIPSQTSPKPTTNEGADKKKERKPSMTPERPLVKRKLDQKQDTFAQGDLSKKATDLPTNQRNDNAEARTNVKQKPNASKTTAKQKANAEMKTNVKQKTSTRGTSAGKKKDKTAQKSSAAVTTISSKPISPGSPLIGRPKTMDDRLHAQFDERALADDSALRGLRGASQLNKINSAPLSMNRENSAINDYRHGMSLRISHIPSMGYSRKPSQKQSEPKDGVSGNVSFSELRANKSGLSTQSKTLSLSRMSLGQKSDSRISKPALSNSLLPAKKLPPRKTLLPASRPKKYVSPLSLKFRPQIGSAMQSRSLRDDKLASSIDNSAKTDPSLEEEEAEATNKIAGQEVEKPQHTQKGKNEEVPALIREIIPKYLNVERERQRRLGLAKLAKEEEITVTGRANILVASNSVQNTRNAVAASEEAAENNALFPSVIYAPSRANKKLEPVFDTAASRIAHPLQVQLGQILPVTSNQISPSQSQEISYIQPPKKFVHSKVIFPQVSTALNTIEKAHSSRVPVRAMGPQDDHQDDHHSSTLKELLPQSCRTMQNCFNLLICGKQRVPALALTPVPGITYATEGCVDVTVHLPDPKKHLEVPDAATAIGAKDTCVVYPPGNYKSALDLEKAKGTLLKNSLEARLNTPWNHFYRGASTRPKETEDALDWFFHTALQRER